MPQTTATKITGGELKNSTTKHWLKKSSGKFTIMPAKIQQSLIFSSRNHHSKGNFTFFCFVWLRNQQFFMRSYFKSPYLLFFVIFQAFSEQNFFSFHILWPIFQKFVFSTSCLIKKSIELAKKSIFTFLKMLCLIEIGRSSV